MKEMFSSLVCFYLFLFVYFLWTFFGQGIAPASQRGVKQNNQNMESDILRQHSLALSHRPPKNFQTPHMDVAYINNCVCVLMSYTCMSVYIH